jgi:hypothetical protein
MHFKADASRSILFSYSCSQHESRWDRSLQLSESAAYMVVNELLCSTHYLLGAINETLQRVTRPDPR